MSDSTYQIILYTDKLLVKDNYKEKIRMQTYWPEWNKKKEKMEMFRTVSRITNARYRVVQDIMI